MSRWNDRSVFSSSTGTAQLNRFSVLPTVSSSRVSRTLSPVVACNHVRRELIGRIQGLTVSRGQTINEIISVTTKCESDDVNDQLLYSLWDAIGFSHFRLPRLTAARITITNRNSASTITAEVGTRPAAKIAAPKIKKKTPANICHVRDGGVVWESVISGGSYGFIAGYPLPLCSTSASPTVLHLDQQNQLLTVLLNAMNRRPVGARCVHFAS